MSFFFQAEDGIRHKLVTGVQTCALPISRRLERQRPRFARLRPLRRARLRRPVVGDRRRREIGRASCRERVEASVRAVSLKQDDTEDEETRRVAHVNNESQGTVTWQTKSA